MTTIAYHKASGQFAGDKMFLVCGDSPVPITKIFKSFQDLLYAASGGIDNANMFYKWVEQGRPDDKKPNIIGDDGFSGIVIEDGEIYRYEKGLYGQLIPFPFWAIGSGQDFAIGAMEMGADAKKAIEIASKFDIHSGLGIDVLYYNKGEITPERYEIWKPY